MNLAPEVTLSDLLAFSLTKSVQLIRGFIKGFPNAFFGQNVKILGRKHLKLQKSVVFGDNTYIFAISRNGIQIGARSTIDRQATLLASGVIRSLGLGIEIGHDSSIGLANVIHGGGGVRIGNNCLFGPHVALYSENHAYQNPNVPIREQGELRSPVTIGDDVWIGSHSVVLAGVSIGNGSIIAAGSVVASSIPAGVVAAGVPAKIIKKR